MGNFLDQVSRGLERDSELFVVSLQRPPIGRVRLGAMVISEVFTKLRLGIPETGMRKRSDRRAVGDYSQLEIKLFE